jgi:hypothetical protein
MEQKVVITRIKYALEANEHYTRATANVSFLPLSKGIFGLNNQFQNIDFTSSSWLEAALNWLKLLNDCRV